MDHTIVHFEIPVNDVEKLKKFYSDLFGWKIEKTQFNEYYSVSTVPVDEMGNPLRPGVNGGMMKKQNPEHKPINYIGVESVEEYSKKITALGGQIIMPKTEIPGMGWFALALDPDGNNSASSRILRRLHSRKCIFSSFLLPLLNVPSNNGYVKKPMVFS
ncbi:MAG: VOC family protein [Candidatus Bathyarchaeota archaeon]|nr:VOC family protein [Candidatus Bathyarchaeota archaeon]